MEDHQEPFKIMIGQGCKTPEGICEPKGRKYFVSCHNGVVGALFVEEAIVLCTEREQEGTDLLNDLGKSMHLLHCLPVLGNCYHFQKQNTCMYL